MECKRNERLPTVNRYSISFQEHLTEITHLLPEVLKKRHSKLTGSLSNIKTDSSSSRELLCASDYVSDSEESECEASYLRPATSSRSINSYEFESE